MSQDMVHVLVTPYLKTKILLLCLLSEREAILFWTKVSSKGYPEFQKLIRACKKNYSLVRYIVKFISPRLGWKWVAPMSLFLTTATAAAHDWNSFSVGSLSTVLLHVSLRLDRFRFFHWVLRSVNVGLVPCVETSWSVLDTYQSWKKPKASLSHCFCIAHSQIYLRNKRK